MRVASYTLGCKLNQCESEALAHAFLSRGFFVVAPNENPDLVIVNTCTVTSKAEQKARRILKKIAEEAPGAALVVTGCYAQMAREEIQKTLPGAWVVSMTQKANLADLPLFLETDCPAGEPLAVSLRRFFLGADGKSDPFAFESAPGLYHVRSFVKIQDGCDNACRYCRVRLARGKSVSLPFEEALRRITAAEAAGAAEIVLSGVNLSQYRDGASNLSDLIEEAVQRLTSARVRLSSLEPDFVRLSSLEPDFVDEKLVRAVSHPKVCPHFHLALQSGSSAVLARMGRHYDAERAVEAVRLLRNAKEDPFLAADVITGFDGESDDEFLETERFIAENAFHALHVFPFSPRPGTEAAVPKHPVAQRIRDERAAVLRKRSQCASEAYRQKWASKPADVIVEECVPLKGGGFLCEGLSERYLRYRFESPIERKKGSCLRNFFAESVDIFL